MLDGLTQAYEMVGVVFDDIVRECVLFDLLDKEVVRDD
jgi:hypothetical protein